MPQRRLRRLKDNIGYWTGRGWSSPLSKLEAKLCGRKTHWWSSTSFEFRQDCENPLTFISITGHQYRPPASFIHNFGSIPRLLRWFPCFDTTRYANTYVLHDGGYKPPHVILISLDNGKTFNEYKASQEAMDNLLEEAMSAEGSLKITSIITSTAVRLFGSYSWKTNNI